MKTDWQIVRELMNSVIDSCEAIENLEITEADKTAPLQSAPANVWDALQSTWTYPENVQYEVIRVRHELNIDKSHTPEAARALINAAKVCAELIEAGETGQIRDSVLLIDVKTTKLYCIGNTNLGNFFCKCCMLIG